MPLFGFTLASGSSPETTAALRPVRGEYKIVVLMLPPSFRAIGFVDVVPDVPFASDVGDWGVTVPEELDPTQNHEKSKSSCFFIGFP